MQKNKNKHGDCALINMEFAKRQNLSDSEIEELNNLYRELSEIFTEAEKAEEEKELIILSMKLEDLEYRLQKTWKLEQDQNKHSYWYRIPQCNCPKLDNMDLWGTSTRIFTTDCKVHKHLFTHISNMRH